MLAGNYIFVREVSAFLVNMICGSFKSKYDCLCLVFFIQNKGELLPGVTRPAVH
jgi:hypothetical protein